MLLPFLHPPSSSRHCGCSKQGGFPQLHVFRSVLTMLYASVACVRGNHQSPRAAWVYQTVVSVVASDTLVKFIQTFISLTNWTFGAFLPVALSEALITLVSTLFGWVYTPVQLVTGWLRYGVNHQFGRFVGSVLPGRLWVREYSIARGD